MPVQENSALLARFCKRSIKAIKRTGAGLCVNAMIMIEGKECVSLRTDNCTCSKVHFWHLDVVTTVCFIDLKKMTRSYI